MTTIRPFTDFLKGLSDEGEVLEEALITLGGQRYPNFNTILILQGGAASGKDFILEKLIGIEGKIFDVDRLKELVVQSEVLSAKIKEETGIELSELNFKNPDNVGTLHRIVGELYEIDTKFEDAFFRSVATAHPDRKPNVIFNVTGKSMKHFNEVREFAENYGYPKENIHTVWVLDDVQAAIEKNVKRSRTVPEDILIETHQGASLTSKKLLSMGRSISKYMDGDYWIVFNKMFVDSTLEVNKNERQGSVLKSRRRSKGHYIKDAQYFRLKQAGDAPIPVNAIKQQMLTKIQKYVPGIDTW